MKRKLLLWLALGTTAWADDPHRFIAVTNWYATFTHTLSENGSRDYTDPYTGETWSANWHWNRNIVISGQLIPDPQGGGDPDWRNFIWKQNDSASVSINDSYDETCTSPGCSGEYLRETANGIGLAPTNMFDLIIDATAGTYQVGWCSADCGVPVTSDTIYDGISLGPSVDEVSWGPDGSAGFLPLPSTGMVLQGQAVYPMHDYYCDIIEFCGGIDPTADVPYQTDLVLTWTLSPTPPEELEVVVDPVDYETWLPEGNLEDPDASASFINVRAMLQKKGGGTPTVNADKFTFELANVSREPGVCMNFPPVALAKTGWDLQFETDLNLMPLVSQPINVIDSLHAETVGTPTNAADVNVSSFDFGAYGTIKVTATVGGKPIVGYLRTDSTRTLTEVPLPRRAPTSYVADYWKEQEDVTELANGDDSENDPPGDGHKGDGFTLYEEYRGFAINGNHTRLDPKKKDLFVLNDSDLDADVGLALFAHVSGLVAHKVGPKEFGLQPDSTYSRVLNYNHNQNAPHSVDQHGIWIVTGETNVGYHIAENEAGFEKNSTPGTKSRIIMNPGAAPGEVGTHILGSDGSVSVRNIPLLAKKASDAAHEVGHCCCLYHHGDQADQAATVLGGTNSDGTYDVRVVGVGKYHLLNESNTPRRAAPGTQFLIGTKQGTHSGDERCLMRYDIADAYFSNTAAFNTIYLITSGELTGFSLCASAKGTGVNAPAPGLPWPRYGDADASNMRGNCRGQICVNDLYATDPLHSR